jgi:hypothetical protein
MKLKDKMGIPAARAEIAGIAAGLGQPCAMELGEADLNELSTDDAEAATDDLEAVQLFRQLVELASLSGLLRGNEELGGGAAGGRAAKVPV